MIQKEESSDSSSSDSDSSSDSSSSDSENEEVKAKPAKKEESSDSSSSSSSDSDDSDDDSDDGKGKAKAKEEPAVVMKVEASSSSDSDSDSDSSSSSSSSSSSDDEKAKEETEETKSKAKPTETKKSKDDDSSDSSSSSDSDSDSDSSSSDSDDDNEADAAGGGAKRKIDFNKDDQPQKKQAVSSDTGGEDGGNTKIYVRGLPWRATEDEVYEYFASCEEKGCKSVELPLQDDGRSSGTAIIEFHTSAGAAAAMELNGADFNGRWLSIKYSTPKPILAPREPTQKQEGCITVFVGNLAWDVDEDSLRDAFKDCGEITQVRFSTDRETGDFKGYGHIEFAETEATDAAVKVRYDLLLTMSFLLKPLMGIYLFFF